MRSFVLRRWTIIAPLIALSPLVLYRLVEFASARIGATTGEVLVHLAPPLGMALLVLALWRLVPPLPLPAPKKKPGHLGRAIAIGMLLGTLAALVNLLLMLASNDKGGGTSGMAVAYLATTASLTPGTGALVIHVMVLAPVCEELAFRGLIYRIFRRSMLPLAAGLLSALIFGLMHVEPTKAIWAFFLGVVAALAYERTRSLLAPILIHALFNAVPVGVAVLRARPDDAGPIWFVLGIAALIFTISARAAGQADEQQQRLTG